MKFWPKHWHFHDLEYTDDVVWSPGFQASGYGPEPGHWKIAKRCKLCGVIRYDWNKEAQDRISEILMSRETTSVGNLVRNRGRANRP